MRIERVRLINFCQHAERDDTFSSGVIGITGKNGAGKSMYLRAIRRAITGDSGNPGNKEDDLRWGADKGSVRVDFTANSRKGYVHRDLASSRCRMEFDDGTKCATHTEIDKKIYDILGISPKVLSDIVFVEQGAIEGLLFQKPSKRTESMQSLFGTAMAEPIREHLKVELDSTVVTSRADVIGKIRTRLATDILPPLREAEAFITQARTDLLPESEIKRLDELISRYDAQQRSTKVFETLQNERAELQRRLAEETAVLDRSLKIELELKELYTILEKPAEKAVYVLSDNKAAQRVLGLQEQARQAITLSAAQLATPAPNKPAFTDAQFDELHMALQKATNDLTNCQNMATAKPGAPCPTCGQHVSREHVDSASKMLDQLVPSHQQMSSTYMAWSEARKRYDQDLAMWGHTVLSARKTKEEAEALLAGLTAVSPPTAEETAEAAETVSNFNSIRENLTKASQTVATRKATLEQLNAALIAAMKHAGTVTESLGDVVDAENYQKAKVARQHHDKACSELSEASGRVLTLKQLKENEERALAQYEQEERKLDKIKAWRETVERARGLLHRDQLPAVVARMFLEGINKHLVRYLDLFNVPFTACITPEGVKCTFSSRNDVPAERLSGGQKVMLGLAFRFAVYDQFVSSLGIMILDEPTVYLDDDNVDVAVELLLRVKGYSKSAGLQLIVVTHDQRLASVFDQSIVV